MTTNLNNKKFKAISNSENGEVSSATLFRYFQKDTMIWAEYSGGEIVKGNLLGTKTSENLIRFVYQHLNVKGELLTGKCVSVITILENKKIQLSESWQWTSGDFSFGTSILIEM